MSWSPAQQALLAAMGYTLHARVGAMPAPAPARSVPDPAPSGDRLMQALRRAARGRELGPALPPLDQLRADAAAKRALWPVLRALRRG